MLRHVFFCVYLISFSARSCFRLCLPPLSVLFFDHVVCDRRIFAFSLVIPIFFFPTHSTLIRSLSLSPIAAAFIPFSPVCLHCPWSATAFVPAACSHDEPRSVRAHADLDRGWAEMVIFRSCVTWPWSPELLSVRVRLTSPANSPKEARFIPAAVAAARSCTLVSSPRRSQCTLTQPLFLPLSVSSPRRLATHL